MASKKYPFYHQHDAMDCGATCLRMIAKYHGKNIAITKLRERCFTDRQGVSLLGISDAADSIGLRSMCLSVNYETLSENLPLPFIAYWKEKHFIVVYEIKNDKIVAADPGYGIITLSKEEFLNGWINKKNIEDKKEGYVLVLEPTPEFYNEEEAESAKKFGFNKFLHYYINYKKFFYQLILGLVVTTIIQIIFPFLTQSLVDIGIDNQDIGYVYLVILGQIMLFFSRTLVEFVRNWLFLHLGERVQLSMKTDFLAKVMKLPMAFFDKKKAGDLQQRLFDHNRIHEFLSVTTINTFFGLLTLIVFGAILIYYDLSIFLIFFFGSVLHIAWIFLFLKRRKILDYKNFDQEVLLYNNVIQLLGSVQELKLQSYEKQKRWEYERIQAKMFKLQIRKLSMDQWQGAGLAIINELKNILLTFYSAKLVIDGEITLGMMLAIQYIIGQLNGPIQGIIQFIQNLQAALISMERIGEIHSIKNEDEDDDTKVYSTPESLVEDIHIKNLSFQYGGKRSPYVLKDINLTIPIGKVTAIVGHSGSGKTTLLKILLKYYEPTEGTVFVGQNDFKYIKCKSWRNNFATVMQESYIFSDTITNNIVLGMQEIDKQRLKYSTEVANIRGFIEKLPIGYNTKIGDDGVGLSQGQKQRILIARAVYKNTPYIILDEATNSLDANNEKLIVNKLDEFFENRTVIVVAHRLSTVKNADQIVVLGEGSVIEVGTHSELIDKKGAYYELVKNQLELAE